MAQNATKNQHYIPQSLLVHFADPNKKIFEVLVQNKNIFQTNISNTMCETYTYEYDKLPRNTIENFFCKIESEVAPLVLNLIGKINKFKNNEVKLEEIKEIINKLLPSFLIFYYRSGALLTEFSSVSKEGKIPLLSEKILDHEYINKLSKAIIDFYDFAIIESSDDFLLSDQFISTAAIKIKSRFLNISNRNIGLNETIILIPISSSFYLVFWNTKDILFLDKNKINFLNTYNLKLINNTIINNSYVKCVSKKENLLKESLEKYRGSSPVQFFAGGNPSGFHMGSTTKKEVFLFEKEREVYELLDYPFRDNYKDLSRNDICPCGSGKKYKKCHEDIYKRLDTIYLTFSKGDIDVMKDSLIYRINILERPIHEWNGFLED